MQGDVGDPPPCRSPAHLRWANPSQMSECSGERPISYFCFRDAYLVRTVRYVVHRWGAKRPGYDVWEALRGGGTVAL